MNSRAWRFLSLVAIGAIALILALPLQQLYNLDASSVQALFWLGAISLIAEAAALNFSLGSSQRAVSSLAYLPFLTTALLFDPLPTILTIGVVVGISNVFVRGKTGHVVAFNMCQAMLAIGLGGIAYHTLSSGLILGGAGRVLGFIALASVFFTTNLALLAAMVALMKEDSFISMLRELTGPRASNLLYDLLASPIALVPAIMYEAYYVYGVLIIVFPLVLLRYSYATKSQLETANQDLLGVLVTTIETRDPYTSGHSQRVARVAERIAKEMALSSKMVRTVTQSGLLHDIGKIDAEYSPLIAKPHDLSEAERKIIQTHPQRGAELLRSLSQVGSEIVESVLHHHERYDGEGYPSGISGSEIPIPARIIMVCDAVDAMLSDRPYRKALSVDVVRRELVRCSGSQFDPAVVSAVLKCDVLDYASELASEGMSGRGKLSVLAS